MTEWISIKDKLPPLHLDVLIYISNVENHVKYIIGYYETDGNFYFNTTDFYFDENDNIIDGIDKELLTHWMFLPEPPEINIEK